MGHRGSIQTGNVICEETSRPQDYFFSFSTANMYTFIAVRSPFEAAQPHSWVTLFSLIHSSVPQLRPSLIGPIAIAVQKTKGGTCQNPQVEISDGYVFIALHLSPLLLGPPCASAHTVHQMCALGPFVCVNYRGTNKG